MKAKPYIGVTDFRNPFEVERILKVFRASCEAGSFGRRLHVGVALAEAMLRGEQSIWTGVNPPVNKIKEIFWSAEAMNCLHFVTSSDRQSTSKDLADALRLCGDNLKGLELHMVWPQPRGIEEALKLSRKNIEVILRLGQDSLDEVGNDPSRLVDRLRRYRGIVQHVIFDASGGMGMKSDVRDIMPFLKALKEAFHDLGIGIGGDLSYGNTGHLAEALRVFPDLSMNARTKLRTDDDLLKPIDWFKAEKFVENALKTLGNGRR